MFNLESSITAWRNQMFAAGIRSPASLAELENHLREEIERQTGSGLDESAAFHSATHALGQAATLKIEFARAGGTFSESFKQFILTLTGQPNPQLVTTMNTSDPNPSLEPRWATYARATAFLFPAAFLWLFSVLFLLPKLQEICQHAGTMAFNFDHAPAIFKGSAIIGQLMVFLTAHGFLISGAVVLAFILLEWRSHRWPHYRRTALGIGIFLFNFAVLLSITLMVVSAIIAIPALTHLK